MSNRLYFVADAALPEDLTAACQEWASQLADYAGEPVAFGLVNDTGLADLRSALGTAAGVHQFTVCAPRAAVSRGPMSSAEFIWREDGRPDWAAMWTGFCDLALYGGPPHRGEESALHAPEQPSALTDDSQAIAEIRRGIWETTGLYAELDPEQPGWIAVTCHSRKMAAWLCASIILENVDARFEEERLFLPASPDFGLKNEVKSVITVLAKTNHYWQAHVEAQEAAAATAGAAD
jgi:hypothetical protein